MKNEKLITVIKTPYGEIKHVPESKAKELIATGIYYYVSTDIPQFNQEELATIRKTINQSITAVVVNYQTVDLITQSVTQFRKYYPHIPLIIIDNSSFDKSSDWVYQFAKQDHRTTCVFNTFNFHHGPALHIGMTLAKTNIVFTFDSDMFIVQEGLLEAMYTKTLNTEWYGMGFLETTDYTGYIIKNAPIKCINPRCALFNRDMYVKFKPFKKHGAPCIDTMTNLYETNQSHLLLDFNFWYYVKHEFLGTVKRTGGYHLENT